LHTEGIHNGYGKNYKETRDFLISNGYQQTEQCALLGNEGWNVCFMKEI
jgi:hypothetical protein